MNLCNSGHDEIVHEGNTCPICELIERFTEEIGDLEEQVVELEETINSQYESVEYVKQYAPHILI